MKKKVILFAVVFFSLTCNLLGRNIGKELREKGIHVACLSEEDKINLQINRLEQAIRQQSIGDILRIVTPDYLENNSSFNEERLSEILERSFSIFANNRGFPTQVNEKTGWKVTATQDFCIRNVEMQIDDNKPKVQCEMGFFLASNYVTNETLTFCKVGSNWLLSGSEHLFSSIEEASAKVNDGGHFASILSG